jgi:HTH-type transcriptional regulator, competence development regulator
MEKRFNQEIKALGKRIRDIRKERGISQDQLEVDSGIVRSEISRIENGLRNVEFYTIVRLAIALNVEIADFFKKTRQSKPSSAKEK